MEFNPLIPIWLQVETDIKLNMIRGTIAPGSKLPGGRDLALQYTINPNTAARVYQELEKEGLCQTRRGLGTFATDEPEKIRQVREDMAKNAIARFMAELKDLGYTKEEAITLLIETEDTNHA
ncbi:MAG: GntR family transcriptional regulator [Clostridia bacterium]|nr:GntR family transcriptional regulator [Clostridia bacterium]